MNVSPPSTDGENVSRTRREAEALHSAGTARRGLVATAETGVEQTTGRAEGLTGLEVIREEEGSGTGEEDGGTGRVESGGGDGEFGKVEGLEEGVVGAIDLEETKAAVGSGGEENLGAGMEANLDDGSLCRAGESVKLGSRGKGGRGRTELDSCWLASRTRSISISPGSIFPPLTFLPFFPPILARRKRSFASSSSSALASESSEASETSESMRSAALPPCSRAAARLRRIRRRASTAHCGVGLSFSNLQRRSL